MSDHIIDGARLKTVRKARKIGRPKLAKLAGLTERQLAKLESAAEVGTPLSEAVIARLSQALQIPAPALKGDLPLVSDDLKPAAKPTCTSGCCG